MAESLQVAAKAGVFAGVVLLLGAGVFARWIVRPPLAAPLRAWARRGMLFGALLLACGSALEVIDVITRAAGAFDLSLAGSYLLETRHGNAVIGRLALALLLGLAGGPPDRAGARDRLVFVGLGVTLLFTLTLVSHAGAQGRGLAILVDLLHVVGVAAWGGSLIYAGWLLAWPGRGAGSAPALAGAQRLSMLGAACLTLIVGTGVYAAAVRLPDVEALTRTPYGRALLIKVAAVAVVVTVAAINRWVAIPWMTRGLTSVPLRRLIRVESALVLVVLGLTGVLVSQPLPEPPATVAEVLDFNDATGPWVLHGTVAGRGTEGFAVEVRVHDRRGTPAPETMTVDLELVMPDMVMEPLRGRLPRVGPGVYRGTYQLPMTGRWQLTVHTPGGAVRVQIPTQEARVPAPQVRWNLAGPGLLGLLIGLSLTVTGLRHLGAGARPVALPLAAGVTLVFLGAAVVVRAVV